MEHKTVISRKIGVKCVLVIAFFLIAYILSPVKPNARGGIAVSGSLYRHHFKMVPGESFSSPSVNIVVFNNYDEDINVRFLYNVPYGVQVDMEKQEVVIPANENIRFPVGLTLQEDVVPGEYEIGVSADVMPMEGEGISVAGSAQLRTKLTVFGEAARVRVNTKTNQGEAFAGQMHLFRKEDESLIPAGYSQTGTLNEVVIPGEYMVQVFWDGYEVGLKEFSAKDGDDKDLEVIVRTVFVDSFSVRLEEQSNDERVSYNESLGNIFPVLLANQGLDIKEVSTARVTYNVKNVHKPIEDASVILKVYHAKRLQDLDAYFNQEVDKEGEKELNKHLIDEIEVFSVPLLEVGSRSGRYSYSPPGGWESGSYRFSLDVYGKDGVNYTQGKDLKGHNWLVDIQITKSRLGLVIFILIVIAIVIGIILLVLRANKVDCGYCDGTGIMICEKCNGRGRVIMELDGKQRDVECKICFGEGVVDCLSCK